MDDFEGLLPHPPQTPATTSETSGAPDEAAYQVGFTRTLREFALATAHGFTPTERQLVLALTQTVRVYSAARSGKYVSGQRPDWLRGRADALREIIRRRGDTQSSGL
ncbi:MAG TPA: hypothetical protein VKQ36_11090 [Ktedonobacterales bacterium]|nr:hypothetical protein [Ktedonobacterales bacterium]